MKTEITTRLANKELDPIVKFCAANRGSIARIQAIYSKVVGSPIQRANIERWLHKDKARRREPTYGAALLLLKVAAKVKREMERK